MLTRITKIANIPVNHYITVLVGTSSRLSTHKALQLGLEKCYADELQKQQSGVRQLHKVQLRQSSLLLKPGGSSLSCPLRLTLN